MARVSKRTWAEVAELMTEWAVRASQAVEDPTAVRQRAEDTAWASQATGPVDWAFEALSEALTPDEQAAVSAVVYWAAAGLLHQALNRIDPAGGLTRRRTEQLRAGGYIPFVTTEDADPRGADHGERT